MKVSFNLGTLALKTMACALPLVSLPLVAQNPQEDRFEHSVDTVNASDKRLLSAPSPIIEIAGKNKVASIVVDLSENQLYHYDKNGVPQKVYRIASGKKSTPTATGIRRISHVENYPYKNAIGTKRRDNPSDYGPKVIYITIIDPKTGRDLGANGEFIHGTNKPSSIGKYASKGCMRMKNEEVLELSKLVKSGQYVLIKK